MSRLRLYRNDFERGVLGLTITLDKSGKVKLEKGKDKEAAKAAMRLVGDGVLDPHTVTMITPKDGARYLDAVDDMFASSSHWLVSREDD